MLSPYLSIWLDKKLPDTRDEFTCCAKRGTRVEKQISCLHYYCSIASVCNDLFEILTVWPLVTVRNTSTGSEKERIKKKPP